MQNNGRVVYNYISSTVENIYEVTSEQVYKDGYLLYKMITKDTIDKFNSDLKASFNNLSYFTNEHKITTPSGIIKHILILAKPEKQADGLVVWYGFKQDISDKKLEEENC